MEKKYTVLSGIIINGVHYLPGDTLSCPEWQAKRLSESGVIGNTVDTLSYVVENAVQHQFKASASETATKKHWKQKR